MAIHDLVATVIGSKRGLAQGGSLSPLLLNLYLDHHLDRPWTKRNPQWPLIRVADDLLLLGADRTQANEARKVLEARLRSAAMPLKGTPQTAIRDLGAGQSATWLGYHLAKGREGVVARLPDDGPTWTRLRQHLATAHDEPDAPLAAIATIQGWIGSLGPCYRHANIRDTHARLSRIARDYAFEEIPTIAELEARWAQAYERWEEVRVRRKDRGT